MKRVHCLYRVSTKQQVDKEKNDIPMQRLACREFAENQKWIITKEFEEKGVSGFKVSASDRDAIQELKEAAINDEFDILLVFMFDRIGRIDDETPFVVEWFVKHGIEVWSVKEGEQRFDSHVDKLTNYIRFWQASGESEKTSMRIKTRMKQLTEEGLYTGGHVPYGYDLVKNGRVNKRGNEISDLQVNPEEAETVRWIFNKTVNEGFSPYSIAKMLNEKGLKTHSGSKFQRNTVIRILNNKLYCGYYISGEAVSPQIKDIQIIDEKIFNDAQYIINQRLKKNTEQREISSTNRSKALLTGVAYCAHCGCRLTSTQYHDKYVRKDGSVYEVEETKYYCYHRGRRLNDCDGQATYSAEKIDNIVLDFMRDLFQHMKGCPKEDQIKRAYKEQMSGNIAKQKRLTKQISKESDQLTKLQQEIGKALLGESLYTSEDLSTAINNLKSSISEATEELESLKDEEKQKKLAVDSIIPAYNQFKSWADEFESASLETKKMIACRLFKRVEIGRGYTIKITLNMTYKQFCDKYIDDSNSLFKAS